MRNKSLVYCVYAVMTVALSFAEFMDIPSLGVGLLAALFALGQNAPILSVFLVLVGLIDFSPVVFFYNLVAAVIFSALWLVDKKVKLKGYWAGIGAIAAQLGLVVAGAVMRVNVVAIFVSVFLSLVFAYLAFSFGVPVIRNRLRFKLLDSELIAGGIVLIALSYGLSRIPVNFPIVIVFFAFGVLISAKVFGSGAMAVGFCFALGYALGAGVELVGAFMLMSLTALVFAPAPRILSTLSLITSLVMFTFFFNVVPDYAYLWLIALLVGGGFYMALPHTVVCKAKDFFAPDGRKALRGMVNRNRVATGVRLQSISDVFGKMSVIMDGEDVSISDNHIGEFTEQLVGRVCSLCRRYSLCVSEGVIGSVGKVMESALLCGRASVTELPAPIKSSCTCLAALISTSGELAHGYSERLAQLKNISGAKKMVASQLSGISLVLSSLAKKEAEPLRFDADVEKKIAEELTYRAVVTSEALVTGSGYPLSVMLTVLTDTLDVDVIKAVLRKKLGVSFAVDKTESDSISGWTVVYTYAKPRFDVVFSVSSCPKDKNGVSGDTHSFVKIDSHRFLMAVCDGMGSGAKAREFSSSTISLIENFYKADFNHKLVLSSVNNFLSLSSEEIYSAVDIAVVDLENGLCDIIKIGSPTSYIKTKDSVLRVEGSSLPIGVLEEMKPTVMTYSLKGGETVVLTSDGAADSFGGDGLADVINNCAKLPEQMCKSVVDCALKNTDGIPCDDITVAAFYVFESV